MHRPPCSELPQAAEYQAIEVFIGIVRVHWQLSARSGLWTPSVIRRTNHAARVKRSKEMTRIERLLKS